VPLVNPSSTFCCSSNEFKESLRLLYASAARSAPSAAPFAAFCAFSNFFSGLFFSI
jgi:hypothetical protein